MMTASAATTSHAAVVRTAAKTSAAHQVRSSLPGTWLVKTANGKEMLQGKAGTVTRLGNMDLRWSWSAAKRIETVTICLENSNLNCITSQGAGNQLKLEQTGVSHWTVFSVGGSGQQYQMQTQTNQYCMREKNDNSVVGEDTGSGCPGYGSDSATQWTDAVSNTVAWSILYNQDHTSDNLCTFGTLGKPLWGDPGGETNEWNEWNGIKQ
jgi:hypothetical protein